ncbi:MAG: glycosyltransferase, partial [Planctomycetes bacterium]|nr:glycosyltransferase [Planctomycetota bacterium]
MKLSFCLIAFNEAATLRANLDHLYPHAHEIIVCEGSIRLLRDVLGVGPRSNDGTLEILADYPDRQRKLRVIQRAWRDKDEMSAAYAELVTGDLLWHVDADEFYDDEVFAAVPREFEDPSLQALEMPMRIFWKSPRWILAERDGNDLWCRVPRALRVSPGMSVSHVPVRRIIRGVRENTGIRPPCDPRILNWHYGWNDDARVRMKMQIYSRRDAKTTRANWIENVWDRWTPDSPDHAFPAGVHPATAWQLWPRPFRGEHPRCVRALLPDLVASNSVASDSVASDSVASDSVASDSVASDSVA